MDEELELTTQNELERLNKENIQLNTDKKYLSDKLEESNMLITELDNLDMVNYNREILKNQKILMGTLIGIVLLLVLICLFGGVIINNYTTATIAYQMISKNIASTTDSTMNLQTNYNTLDTNYSTIDTN